MNCPKSVRTAAIVSQVFIVAWAALSFLSSIFQKGVVGLFINSSYVEDTVKIIPAVTIVLCFKALLLSAANILMCKGKGLYSPLIMTAVTMDIFPIMTTGVFNIQADYYSIEYVSSVIRHFMIVHQAESILSNILSAAAVITVAAAAVYAYAKKNTSEKTEEIISE